MGQGIELFLPEDAVVLDPLRGGLHGLGSEAAAVDAAVDFALEEAGGFEHAEMLGDGGKGKGEGRGEFGDGGLAVCKAGEDGAAGGVGERGEGGVERNDGTRGIVNHTVYYCRMRRGVSRVYLFLEMPSKDFTTEDTESTEKTAAREKQRGAKLRVGPA